MAASQLVWDYTGNVLDKDINTFNQIREHQTCVDWHVTYETLGHLDSEPCTLAIGVICEIISG